MIKKIKHTILSINSLNKLISNRLFRLAAKSDIKVNCTNEVFAGRALVLAPHPDDEVFGCAGAMIKHVKKNDPVKVVICSDGSLGFPDGFRPSTQEKKKMVETREAESRLAAEAIGVSDLVFLRYKDGELVANKNNISFMSQLISEYKPDIIYCPALDDPTSDHRETTKILSKSIASTDDNLQIFQYEIWSPVCANFFLNIDDLIEIKKSLISSFKSQLTSRDYLDAMTGLNRYRGAMSNASKYAEAYFRSNKKFFDEYYKLVVK